jgi:hypothetical protein
MSACFRACGNVTRDRPAAVAGVFSRFLSFPGLFVPVMSAALANGDRRDAAVAGSEGLRVRGRR